MGEAIGKLITCDRCKTSCFLKYTGEFEADGGYTRSSKYEAAPDGWGWHKDNIGHLCPKCNAEYENLIIQFMSKTVVNTGAADKTPDWFTGGDRGEIFG